MKRKQWIAGLGLGVAIAGGSLLVATVSPIGLAGAQDENETTEEGGSDTETAEKPGRHGVLDEVLDELVAEGTIDQADADAVAEAMAARAEEFRANHPGRKGQGRGPGFGRGHHEGPGGEELLEALDMTREELRDALAEGQTIEELAEAVGVDLAALAEQRLDEAQARLDEALADGSISDVRAERTQERIDATREVLESGELPSHGPGSGFGHGHRWGPGGPSDDGDDEER